MCVYGMLHVAWYFSCTYLVGRYLNVAFHRHYDYIPYTQRERGREGDVRI